MCTVVHFDVPTTRVRHHVTETEDIAAAIDLGVRRWPTESRINVVRRLILEGAAQLVASPIERALQIEHALDVLESLSDCYPDGYLEQMRKDWEQLRR